MRTYRLEMLSGQPTREVDADTISYDEEWIMFYRKPPQGGTYEYWRVKNNQVVSIETTVER